MLPHFKYLIVLYRSKSIYRSASALTALICVSLSGGRREIYVNISHIESIFHLETLAASFVSSHTEKNLFLLLAKLARETVVAVRAPSIGLTFDRDLWNIVLQLWPSPETAERLRDRLKRVLELYRCATPSFPYIIVKIEISYRLSGFRSLVNTIGEACAICAEAASTCISRYARSEVYMHILETVYFAVIFILRSINQTANYFRSTADRHVYMILRALTSWVDAIVYRCLCAVTFRPERFDMNALEAKMSFRSLVLSYVPITIYCCLFR